MSFDVSNRVNDPQRLAALQESGLLDTAPEAAFDRLTTLASKVLGVPIALVSLVDAERQFFKSQNISWCEARQTPHSHSFCKHVVASGEAMLIEDARVHPLVKDNLSTLEANVVAYAGIPLVTSQGHTLGSFCAIDFVPRQWSEGDIEILRGLAAAAMSEVELRVATAQLRTNLSDVYQARASGEEAVQMLVHDLRTPLSSLLMGLQLVPSLGQLNADQQEMLSLSLHGGERVLSLVNTILDVAKMQSGTWDLNWQDVNAAALIEGAARQVASIATYRGITLSVGSESDLPPFRADEDKLQRALVNLLGNALKFSPVRSSVSLEARRENDHVAFAVSDSGQGIAPEERERIFQKFAQANNPNSATNVEGGTGLGLTFCDLVARAHGGCIRIESPPGEGATFILSVPLRPETGVA